MPVSVFLTSEEMRRLQEAVRRMRLKETGLKSAHELLRVKDRRASLILYRSGKLVYDGGEVSKGIVAGVLEVEDKFDFFLGSDEAGKGEWFGPLVVACVAATPEQLLSLRLIGVRDSKTIPKTSLPKLSEDILSVGVAAKTLALSPERYNSLYEELSSEGKNLNDLMAWAHARVIKDALSGLSYRKALVVVDEFDAARTSLQLEGLPPGVSVLQKKRAESEAQVAAASILAKQTFEKEVDLLEERSGLELRGAEPSDVPADILPRVAKMHFRNVA